MLWCALKSVAENLYSTVKQFIFFISLEMPVVIRGMFQVHSSPIFNLNIQVFYKKYGQSVVILVIVATWD